MNEEIKYLGEVRRLVLKPGDTVVLSVPCAVSDEMSARLKSHLEQEFYGHRVMVLANGMALGILGSEPE